MSRQNETSLLDRSLQKLEYEMEWNMERSLKNPSKDKQGYKKGKKKDTSSKEFCFFTSFAFIAIFVFLLAGQLTGKLNIIDFSTSPSGELYLIDDGKILKPGIPIEEGAQFTTPSQREIVVHRQKNELGSIDEGIASHMNHPKYPSSSYTTREIIIANQRAVLQEPVADAKTGSYKLYVVTENYVYYLQFVVAVNDKGDKEELLQLAEQFNYE